MQINTVAPFVETRYMKAKAWLILKAVKLWLAVALLWLIAAILFVAHVAIGIIKLIFIITLFPLTWVVYVLDRNIYNRIKIQLEELLS
jgi:fatty acid desaturase